MTSPRILAEHHCLQAVKTTSSGAYTPVMIHRTYREIHSSIVSFCRGTLRCKPDQMHRIRVKRHEITSEAVPPHNRQSLNIKQMKN